MANHSFCENCGTPIPLGQTLCASCAPQVQSEFNRSNSRSRKSGGSKILIPIIIGLLAIIAAVIVIFIVFDPFGSDKSLESDTQQTTVQDSDPAPETPTDPVEEEEPEEETPVQPMMACLECGASIPESAQFCPYCGKSQTEPEEEEIEEEVIEEEPEPITMERVDSAEVNTGSLNKVTVSSAYGTSVVSQSGNHDNTAKVTLDNDLTTSWQEGVSGSGVGEGIVYDLDGEYFVEYLAFNLGNWRSTDWYTQNNVPQALDIVINDEIYRVSFPYGQNRYWVALSEPVLTDCVEIYIGAAYPGSVYNDTCIAEVGIYGESA